VSKSSQSGIAASIIMPVYQESPARFARAVMSVLEQTEAAWELLIISDDLRDYAAQVRALAPDDQRIRFLSTGRMGAGPSAARNIGISVARGATIVTLDSDDFFERDKLAIMVPLALEYGLAIDNTRYGHENAPSCVGQYLPPGLGSGLRPAKFFMEIEWPLIAVYDRGRFEEARYPESFRFAEDSFLIFDLLVCNGGAYFVDAPLHNYVVRPVSMSHGPDVGDLAHRTYSQIIATLQARRAPTLLVRAFQRKLALNQNYQQWLAGGGGTFHDFVAEHDLPLIDEVDEIVAWSVAPQPRAGAGVA
jgi:glycosyltransferase involved in cell wall biosynthesis